MFIHPDGKPRAGGGGGRGFGEFGLVWVRGFHANLGLICGCPCKFALCLPGPFKCSVIVGSVVPNCLFVEVHCSFAFVRGSVGRPCGCVVKSAS